MLVLTNKAKCKFCLFSWGEKSPLILKMKEKVMIVIDPNRTFNPSYKNAQFTSVGFSAKIYGATSPCETDAEIEDSIKHQSEWIRKEGDIPIIRDLREVQKTLW